MTINERIKQVRKEKGLNQKQFAALLGVTQSGVSYMEQVGNNVSDNNIKFICNICNVNEAWLRDGTGSPYIQEENFTLDDFVKEHDGTALEIEIIKSYFDMDVGVRRYLMEHFRETLLRKADAPAAESKRTDDDIELMAIHDDTPDTDDEVELLYPTVDPDYREAK